MVPKMRAELFLESICAAMKKTEPKIATYAELLVEWLTLFFYQILIVLIINYTLPAAVRRFCMKRKTRRQ